MNVLCQILRAESAECNSNNRGNYNAEKKYDFTYIQMLVLHVQPFYILFQNHFRTMSPIKLVRTLRLNF